MEHSNYHRGHGAEIWIKWYLRLKGYSMIELGANRLTRKMGTGEIDLICRRGKTLVFCEIKLRKTQSEALFAVSDRQIGRIVRGAEFFLKQNPKFRHFDCRFDVIACAPYRWPTHLKNILIN